MRSRVAIRTSLQNLLKAVAFLFCLGISAFGRRAAAQTGSYTFDFGETHKAPAGLKIEISAQTVQGDVYSETFTFEGGQSEETARDLVFSSLQNSGWTVTKSGTNGILITTFLTSTGEVRKIKKVDSGDNSAAANVSKDGTAGVTTGELQVTQSEFRFGFSSSLADAFFPGTAVVALNGFVFAAPLSPFDSPALAAARLGSLFGSQGFVTSIIGGEVVLDWFNPANFARLGNQVHTDFALLNAANEPITTLTVPTIQSTVPEPTTFLLVGVGLATQALAGAVRYQKRRREGFNKESTS